MAPAALQIREVISASMEPSAETIEPRYANEGTNSPLMFIGMVIAEYGKIIMCDRDIPTKLKDKVYKTAIKPAMVYGAECWAVRKKEERKLHATEMRMLRWARGKTRLDHVRHVYIWNEAHMYPMAEFLREKRLRWFGHVQRRDKDDATRKILQMEVEGKRNRGRPKLRWRDLVKDDMARNQMTTEMAEDRRHWHVMIRAGTLRRVEADR